MKVETYVVLWWILYHDTIFLDNRITALGP